MYFFLINFKFNVSTSFSIIKLGVNYPILWSKDLLIKSNNSFSNIITSIYKFFIILCETSKSLFFEYVIDSNIFFIYLSFVERKYSNTLIELSNICSYFSNVCFIL